MPRYAIIDSNSIVDNVIVWDEASPWQPPEGHSMVKCEGLLCDLGWKYENGEFIPPLEQPAQ